MAYKSFDELWRFENYENVSAEDKTQYTNLNQSKLKVNGTFKKDEKTTMSFEPHNNEDVKSKAHLQTKFFKVRGHILFIEKKLISLHLHNDKKK